MINVTTDIAIHENELNFKFVHSSGPGGQNVNKVATAVELRFDIGQSRALPDMIRAKLLNARDSRITSEGILIINARRYRSQEQNRRDAVERLVEFVRKAAKPEIPRFATRPTRSSKERRLRVKKQRQVLKRLRRVQSDDA
jgi:ribosome-associated protein